MKQGWTKIGTICNIRTGKLDANAASENGAYPFFTCAEKPLRIDSYSYDDECILIAGNGDLNVKYYKGKFDAYQRTYILTLKENVNNIYLPYIYNFFLKYITHLRIQSIGGIIKYIRLGNLTEAEVHIPDLSKQQQIVAELDLLSGMIEKQKAQIEELDKLAQSIFYDMFGDPVTNDKGWEVKKIGEIGKVERGAGISKKDFVEEGLPCIHYGQLHTCLGATTHEHKTCIPKNLLPKYKIAHPGDVIMAITSEDVEGSCTSTAWLGDYDIVVGSDAAIFHHSINGVYISYYTRTKAFYNEKAKYAKGFKVTHISTSEIESISLPLPPLSLQQEFAAKIEAIEAMKAKVRQSLKESETLFNSRMDYYFN